MSPVKLEYSVNGSDFAAAGEASSAVKKVLRQLGLPPDVIRKVSICMYEGEINMVIHADGGTATILIDDRAVTITLADKGPGIPDIALAMQEGYSTADDVVRDLGFGAGMGLPNMRRYADDMRVESIVGEGTTVHMEVLL